MKITFIGAARTVTGSQHLLNHLNQNILLDCGLFQGKREDSYNLNKDFNDYKPKDIQNLVLSHAHIDHSGNIPQFVKLGFNKKIFSTPATKDLCKFMLMDSGYIQEKDIEFVNKRRIKNGEIPFKPLYTKSDAENCFEFFQSFSYEKQFEIGDNISATFFDAGHILGSSIVNINFKENGTDKSLCFSGDLGRPNLAIIRDPQIIPTPDYLILESTYGGRYHLPASQTEEKLASIINQAIKNKGKIIIPAFSVGRTQEIIYFLHKLFEKNIVRKIPIYIDSPLSVNITSVYKNHSECFDDETKEYINHHDDPFSFSQLRYVSDLNESKRLNKISGPMIIVSSSGMCENGRILHHLRNNISDPKNIVLIVGYNAEHTLGRKLVEGEKIIKIFGEEHLVKSQVIVMNSLSAHADRNEILDYVKNFDVRKLKKIFLVHGDYDQQLKLKSGLENIGFNDIHIPNRGDSFVI